jgi:mono/diheme cytochrome c family protein
VVPFQKPVRQHNIHLFAANQLRLRCFLVAAAAVFLLAGCSAQKKACPPPPLTPQQQSGQRLFSATCQACHETMSDTARQGPSLKDLYKKKSLPSGAPANDDRVRDAILMGRPNMPGYQYVLTDEQISDLIAYLHSL